MRFTKFEEARIIGARALQIAMGAPILFTPDKKTLDELHYKPIAIAKKEFTLNLLPITIKRPLPQKVDA